ncbi:hypothetical protein O6H91_Y006100 [Diphasiastrum complanatum]|nr:hypothetical protein O6H91_Y006100 [Diphasiastrum complanatum]
MGRHLSPMVKQDLARLEQDTESRRTALTSLKAYVEKLDSGSMPWFLAQVSESRELDSSRHYAISLYEDVARVHGRLIVPHIPRVMASVTRSLSASGGSVRMQQACSKVVAAIARYTIDPATTAMEAEAVFQELCRPLLDVLTAKFEPLATGAALCLQALVESEKWKLAPADIGIELCFKVAAALREKATQSEAHMHLARSLARANGNSLEQHGASLLRAGKEILEGAAGTEKWRHRLCAVQLLRAVMVVVDGAKLATELGSVTETLDKFKLDRMPHVRNEVAKALQTAKTIAEKEAPQSFAGGVPLSGGVFSDGALSGLSDGEMSLTLSGTNNRIHAYSESQLMQYSPPLAMSSEYSNIGIGSCSSTGSLAKLQPCSSLASTKIQLKSKPRSTSSTSIDSDYSFANLELKEDESRLCSALSSEVSRGRESAISAGDSRESTLHSQICAVVPHVSLCSSKFDQGKELYYGERIDESDPDFHLPPAVSEADGYGDKSQARLPDSLEIGYELVQTGESHCRKKLGNRISHIAESISQPQFGGFHLERVDMHNVAEVSSGSNISENALSQKEAIYKCSESLGGQVNQAAGGFKLGRRGQNGVTCINGHEMHKHRGGIDAHARGGNEWLNSQSGLECNRPSQETVLRIHRVGHNGKQEKFEYDHVSYETPPRRCSTISNDGSYIPQRNTLMVTPEDFLTFSTPKRLVRSLQSSSSSPNTEATPDLDSKLAEDYSEIVDMDVETSSEAGWSVRHNPMAEDRESDKSELTDAFATESPPCNPGVCTLPDLKLIADEKRFGKVRDCSGARISGKPRTRVSEGSSSETTVDSSLSTKSSEKSVQTKIAKEGAAGFMIRFDNTDYRTRFTKGSWQKKFSKWGMSGCKAVASVSMESELPTSREWQSRSEGCESVSSDDESNSKTMFKQSNGRNLVSSYGYRFFRKVYECLVVLFGGSLCAIICLSLAMILVRLLHPKHNGYLVPT